MNDKPNDALLSPESIEKQDDKNTLGYYSSGIDAIKNKYLESIKTNPKDGKELAKKQIRELKSAFEQYKNTKHAKQLLQKLAENKDRE